MCAHVQKQERGDGDVPREEEGDVHEAERTLAQEELPLEMPGVHEVGPALQCRHSMRFRETLRHMNQRSAREGDAPVEAEQDDGDLLVQKENVCDHVGVPPLNHVDFVPMGG